MDNSSDMHKNKSVASESLYTEADDNLLRNGSDRPFWLAPRLIPTHPSHDYASIESGNISPLEVAIEEIETAKLAIIRPSDTKQRRADSAAGKVVLNSSMQVFAKLFGYLSGLVTMSVSARLLSTSGYGDYTIAVVYLSFFGVLADAGIGVIGVREASKNPNELRGTIGTVLALKILAAIVTYGAAGAIVFALPYSTEVKVGTLVLAASLVLASIGGAFDVAFQSQLAMQIPTLAEVCVRVITLCGAGALVFGNAVLGLDQQWLYGLVIGSAAIANVVNFAIKWFGVRSLVDLTLQTDLAKWKYMLWTAAPMGLVAILGQIHYKADAILLSILQTPNQVAVYGVAYKIIDLLLTLFSVFGAMTFPIMASFTDLESEAFSKAAKRVLNICLTLAVPTTAGTILLAPEIIAIIAGGHYPNAVLPLQILAISLIFSFINMIYDYIIIARNKQTSLVLVVMVSIIANISINLYAIPRYSYIGSAIATDVTEGLTMLGAILVANRILALKPPAIQAAKIGIATLGMALMVTLLLLQVRQYPPILTAVAAAATGFVVYVAIMALLRGFDEYLVQLGARTGHKVLRLFRVARA